LNTNGDGRRREQQARLITLVTTVHATSLHRLSY
jgi:hypothetical protein